MPEVTKLNPAKSALLALDCQKGIVELVPGAERILKPAMQAIEAARSAGIRVIHVGVGFRQGYPEVSPDHPTFSRIRDTNRFVLGTSSAEFHPSLAPKDSDIIVYKKRVSAFSGNDLEMILRSNGITHLAFFGIATSGIVLSTVRQASDLDFPCTIVEDACYDADEEVHRVLTQKVFARQATVVNAETFARQMA